MTTSSSQSGDRHLSAWRFWLPLTLQVLLVLMIPIQSLYARMTGTPVVLQTVPVDPYNLFQGYYVTLQYDISQIDTLKPLPGWDEIEPPTDDPANPLYLSPPVPIYVVLSAPSLPEATQDPDAQPAPWTPKRVYTAYPADLGENEAVLKGFYYGHRVDYGLERYFIPEAERDDINGRIRQAQRSGDRQSYLVEVSALNTGNSTPIGLWIEGKLYQF
ncbi:MAG: GDYXXLXY domain-containing protein [Cyanobacteria bacterium J06626_14]